MKMTKKIALVIISVGLIFSAPVFSESILSSATDSVNSGIINTKIAMDESLSNVDIDATVVNGMAIFTGRVNSKEQADELVRIANSISGIKGVDMSGLKIQSKY